MLYRKQLSDDKKTGTLGITAFAQESLGELVYAELPEVGAKLAKGYFNFFIIICNQRFILQS